MPSKRSLIKIPMDGLLQPGTHVCLGGSATYLQISNPNKHAYPNHILLGKLMGLVDVSVTASRAHAIFGSKAHSICLVSSTHVFVARKPPIHA